VRGRAEEVEGGEGGAVVLFLGLFSSRTLPENAVEVTKREEECVLDSCVGSCRGSTRNNGAASGKNHA
jgi:hypothetical protein